MPGYWPYGSTRSSPSPSPCAALPPAQPAVLRFYHDFCEMVGHGVSPVLGYELLEVSTDELAKILELGVER